MSVQLMSNAWATKCRTRGEKLVLLALSDIANDEDQSCAIALRALADKCSMSTKETVQATSLLERNGLIATGHTDEARGVDTYWLDIPSRVGGGL